MDLQDLIHDAVAGVEPADRLTAIQARTATPARAARRWWYAAGGVALATAAAVTVVAVVGDDDPAPGHHHGEHDMVASAVSSAPGWSRTTGRSASACRSRTPRCRSTERDRLTTACRR